MSKPAYWHDRQRRDDAKVAKKLKYILDKVVAVANAPELGIDDRSQLKHAATIITAVYLKYEAAPANEPLEI